MPRLSEAARHLIYPSTIKESVFPRVEHRLASVGYSFDPWQQGLGTIALGVDESDTYAATIGGVVASIPRQCGKTYTVGGLLIGLALEFPGLRAIWTSHHLRTTTATFRSMQGIVRKPKIAPFLGPNGGIRTANGEQEIVFRNGSIIMFGARKMGFGRGMAAIDVEVFDEAQILDIKTLEDMVPATNQAQNPHGGLLFFIGTPPRPDDPGEVFTEKRRQALTGNSDDDSVYVELSADDDADLMDRKQWAKANPSFPYRTPLKSMLRMRKNIPDDASWRREAMGIWDNAQGQRIIDPAAWGELEGKAPAEARVSYGIKFSVDGGLVTLAGARKPESGPVFVEVIESRSMAHGVTWLADWLAERWHDTACITIDGKGGALALVAALRERRVRASVILTPTSDQAIAAYAGLLDAVTNATVAHSGQPGLEESVASAGRREIGQLGGWGFKPITQDGDVTPVEAVALALYGAKTSKRRPGRKAVIDF